MREIPFSAVIPAAGPGRRTGEKVPKPWLDLEGEPMVVRTLPSRSIFFPLRGRYELLQCAGNRRKVGLREVGLWLPPSRGNWRARG